MPSFNLDYLHKGPVSMQSHWELGLKHIYFWRDMIPTITVTKLIKREKGFESRSSIPDPVLSQSPPPYAIHSMYWLSLILSKTSGPFILQSVTEETSKICLSWKAMAEYMWKFVFYTVELQPLWAKETWMSSVPWRIVHYKVRPDDVH